MNGLPKLKATPPAQSSSQRDKILMGADAAFGRHGYSKTTMVDIARAAGVSRASLYQHFSSKEQVFRELVVIPHEESLRLTDEVLARADIGFGKRVFLVVDSRVGYLNRRLYESGYYEDFLRASVDVTRDIVDEFSSRYLDRVAGLLGEGSRLRCLDLRAAGLSQRAAAEMLISGADGQRLLLGAVREPKVFERHLKIFVRLFLAGVGYKSLAE